MTKEDYVARVSSATPLGLVIITYELILEHINNAQASLAGNDLPACEACVVKAREFLSLLMKSLDFKIEISKMLFDTYLNIDKMLVEAYFKKTPEPLDKASEQLRTMLADWTELTKIERDTPVMENAQKLYAGLTYKNGELTEYLGGDENRGYKA